MKDVMDAAVAKTRAPKARPLIAMADGVQVPAKGATPSVFVFQDRNIGALEQCAGGRKVIDQLFHINAGFPSNGLDLLECKGKQALPAIKIVLRQPLLEGSGPLFGGLGYASAHDVCPGIG